MKGKRAKNYPKWVKRLALKWKLVEPELALAHP
jgi:hypothetical protein